MFRALPVFRSIGAMLFIPWLWAVDVTIWRTVRVNYQFLLDSDVKVSPSPREVRSDGCLEPWSCKGGRYYVIGQVHLSLVTGSQRVWGVALTPHPRRRQLLEQASTYTIVYLGILLVSLRVLLPTL